MFNYGVFTGKNTILMFTDKNAIDKQILIQSLVKNYYRGWAAAQPFKGSIEPLRFRLNKCSVEGIYVYECTTCC